MQSANSFHKLVRSQVITMKTFTRIIHLNRSSSSKSFDLWRSPSLLRYGHMARYLRLIRQCGKKTGSDDFPRFIQLCLELLHISGFNYFSRQRVPVIHHTVGENGLPQVLLVCFMIFIPMAHGFLLNSL